MTIFGGLSRSRRIARRLEKAFRKARLQEFAVRYPVTYEEVQLAAVACDFDKQVIECYCQLRAYGHDHLPAMQLLVASNVRRNQIMEELLRQDAAVFQRVEAADITAGRVLGTPTIDDVPDGLTFPKKRKKNRQTTRKLRIR